MSEEQKEQDRDSRKKKAQGDRLRNGETALIPMPGEPGTLAELNVNDLRQQLAHQGLYVVGAAERSLTTAALEWLEDGGWNEGPRYGNLILAIGNVQTELARRAQVEPVDAAVRRAPVQASPRENGSGLSRKGKPGAVRGTITWAEHEEAWAAYSKLYGTAQSAERMAERQGFCWLELVVFLGHEPSTWEPVP